MKKTKILILAATLLACGSMLVSCVGNGNDESSGSESETRQEESGTKSGAIDGLRQGMNGIANGVKNGVEGAKNGIINGVEGVKNSVKRGVNNVKGGLMGESDATEDATRNEVVENSDSRFEMPPMPEHGMPPMHRPPVPKSK